MKRSNASSSCTGYNASYSDTFTPSRRIKAASSEQRAGVFLTLGVHSGLVCSVQEEQACATALILACSTAACDREVSQWATRAFFR